MHVPVKKPSLELNDSQITAKAVDDEKVGELDGKIDTLQLSADGTTASAQAKKKNKKKSSFCFLLMFYLF